MTKRLKNITIVVTRGKHQTGQFINLLKNEGAGIFPLPVLEITKPENWNEVDNAINHLHDFDWIIFSSKNSVDYFMQRIDHFKLNISDKKIAVVGEKTASALKSYDLAPAIQPEDFSASGLLKMMKNEHLQNTQILFPGSDIALSKIPDKLKKAGARAKNIVVYRNVLNTSVNTRPFIKELHKKNIDCITFFSPSAVHNFVLLTGNEILQWIVQNKIAIAVIGNTTKKSIVETGLVPHIIPQNSTSESMVEAIIDYYERK